MAIELNQQMDDWVRELRLLQNPQAFTNERLERVAEDIGQAMTWLNHTYDDSLVNALGEYRLKKAD
jgi:hypothetical protein